MKNPYYYAPLLLTLLLNVGCVHEKPPSMYNQNKHGKWHKQSVEYKDAYFQGVKEAKKEIKNGKMTIYTSGFRKYAKMTNIRRKKIDYKTGLMYKSIAGCQVSVNINGKKDGHNDYILKHYKQKKSL